MSHPNKHPNRERIVKSVTVLALGGAVTGIAYPNVKRIYENGKVAPKDHVLPNYGNKLPSLASSKSGKLHRVTFPPLGPHERIWDIAQKLSDHQNIKEASDNIQTYLPDQKNHFVYPNETITVLENSDGDVVPNPNLHPAD